ncbi:hypothetical protein TELCIR_03612 [Teladorsagia circumcincta]|uniref:Uncharacterized protein n=1 Tax=Teladorsagia circumcincta TaxID=45464 RepID=A0A2G9UXF4_TELCI|nr:hypothetical protein TELCIR_03612 [Teladorsagia circumcincta]
MISGQFERKCQEEAVLGKLDLMSWSLIDDALFHNDSALDMVYAAHSQIANRSFLDMLDKVALIEKIDSFNRLGKFGEEQNAAYGTFSEMGYHVNAFYIPNLNKISRFLEF